MNSNWKPVALLLATIFIGASLTWLAAGYSESLAQGAYISRAQETAAKAILSANRAGEWTALAQVLEASASPIAASGTAFVGFGIMFFVGVLGLSTFRVTLAVSRGIESNAQTAKIVQIEAARRNFETLQLQPARPGSIVEGRYKDLPDGGRADPDRPTPAPVETAGHLPGKLEQLIQRIERSRRGDSPPGDSPRRKRGRR